MATTAALLRSIRRREIASTPVSAYKRLVGNAQPSLGTSYTGQNYASFSRAFGSKPGVSDIVGTGLGSNAIREGREHSKATENVMRAHLRSLGVGVGTPRRVLSTVSGSIKMTEEEKHNSPKIQSFRPLSPHLTVYQPQMNPMLSIFNRISGIYLTGVFFGGYLLYLKMGMIFLTYPGFYQVLFHVQHQLPVITC